MIKKHFKKAIFILAVCLALCGAIVYDSLHSKNPERVEIHTSYTYNYGSLDELVNNSNIIAVVEITSNGKQIGNGPLPETIFTAEVKKSIYNCKKGEEIKLYMIGGKKDNRIYEKSDDPLMKSGEKYLIFAKKNDDGTYTTLSGTQGRMKYDNGKINSFKFANKNSNLTFDNVSEDSMVKMINEVKRIK
ncbi:hypothetical protein DFR55_11016 [Herbinix hemicellulosilytica]|uniref:Putative secreted protein n=1 Tax=Herbinix hemicellulosilytica TaxID=1564487 RepID=A0A0H5SKE5_HERHM|nr:hypothetical protein [Herbinix hemicellulosilytica]RBP58641.1 hypothetical protein DFR55_11016 [Herbinix hemicellulosilytica]CRZ35565.1 putative secreted protein [Herbinix hemicellulosilytica]